MKFRDVVARIKKRRLKHTIKELLFSRKDPHEVAFGFALGMFLSVLPTFGLGMVVALFSAWYLRLNMLATYLGTILVNPFTGPFVYALAYQIGQEVVPILTHAPIMYVIHLGVGGLLLASASSLLSYGIVYFLVYWYREVKDD